MALTSTGDMADLGVGPGRATRIRKRTCHITVIVSRMPEAELQRRLVGLFRAFKKGDRARGPSKEDGKHAGCHRVERAAMADAALVKYAAQLGGDILAGPAGGLVHNDDSCHASSWIGRPVAV